MYHRKRLNKRYTRPFRDDVVAQSRVALGHFYLQSTEKENTMKRHSTKIKVAAVKATHLKKRAAKKARGKVAKAKRTAIKA